MRRFVSGLCCFVVALQVLIGVPLAVCVAFFALVQQAGQARLEISFRSSSDNLRPNEPIAAASGLPALNGAMNEADFAAMVAIREQIGGLEADAGPTASATRGTGHEGFLAELRRIASFDGESAPLACISSNAAPAAGEDLVSAEGTRPILSELLRLADEDESAGQFHQADQWRRLADQIRRRAN